MSVMFTVEGSNRTELMDRAFSVYREYLGHELLVGDPTLDLPRSPTVSTTVLKAGYLEEHLHAVPMVVANGRILRWKAEVTLP